MRGATAGRARGAARRTFAVLLGGLAAGLACDGSPARPSRVVEPGWVLGRPAAGTSLRRGRPAAISVSVFSSHLADARLSVAAVYRTPDGGENVAIFPTTDGRQYLEGVVHLPYALSLGLVVPDAPPPATQTLPPGSRAVELRVYLDLPTPGPIDAPGLIATYPVVD